MRDTIHVNCQRSDVVRKWKNRYPRLVSSYLVINEARDRVAKRRKNGRDGSAVKQQVAQGKEEGERDGRLAITLHCARRISRTSDSPARRLCVTRWWCARVH